MGKIYDIAIVGAGPAGISCVAEAVLWGIKNVILFEKGDNHSATIRKYYKDNKRVDKNWRGQKINLEGHVFFTDGTKESTLDLFDDILRLHKVDCEFSTEIDSITIKNNGNFIINTTVSESFETKNVIIAIGNMGKPNKPDYKIPLKLRKLVAHNLDKCSENEDVLVVGGGDSALEYAYFLADTNRVVLNYRKTEFTRANQTNQNILNTYVNDKKVILKTGIDILSLTEENGLIKANYSDGTSGLFHKAVYAIGGIAPIDFLKKCNVEVDEKGFPKYNENHKSSIDGLYVAGDIASRTGGSIVMSLNHGSKIIKHIKENRLRLQDCYESDCF